MSVAEESLPMPLGIYYLLLRCEFGAPLIKLSKSLGDTVGDPFKDTAGPSLHVLIKLLGTITLVLVALFV